MKMLFRDDFLFYLIHNINIYIYKKKEATRWTKQLPHWCRDVTEPNIEVTMRSGGLTSSGTTLVTRKMFLDFAQALTIRTRGPAVPVVGA